MGKFSELGLHWWEEEDLEDLLEEYPNLLDMTDEELHKMASQLYWEANGLVEQANRLEAKADTIRSYLRAIDK